MKLTCQLDQNSVLPLYEQLYRYIAAQISGGHMVSQSKLPSRRALSSHLSVSESTVKAAYELLEQEGYITSSQRRGYFVNRLEPLPGTKTKNIFVADEPDQFSPLYDFSTSACDASIFPYKLWSKLFRETLLHRPELLQRGNPQGDIELRSTLSIFLQQYRALNAQPQNIVIGAGADYLLSTLLQMLPKNITVGAEDPGYHGIYRNCARLGMQVLSVPTDESGMSAAALSGSEANICYITPSHQFPLGISMPVGRRRELLRWADKKPGRLIIEDDYDSEFRHFSRPLPALQGLDLSGQVCYIGTFSRSLAPSMRLAYMVLPDHLMQVYKKEMIKSGETVSRFEQQTLARSISEGSYSRHLRKAGNIYARRLKKLIGLLSEIPDIRIFGEQAGLHFLLHAPQHSEKELLKRALDVNIPLHGLSEYYHREKAPLSTLVLGFAGLKDEKLPDAVKALRSAWEL